jgi:uncharacterized membrane protein
MFDVRCSGFDVSQNSMTFHFFQPVWLLLLVPLAAAWFVWPLPGRGLKLVRAAVFILATFAIAELAIRLPNRAGTVVVVADRSESMPPNAAAAEKEVIDLLHKSMGPHDLLGIVSFARQAVIEQTPQHGEFGGFTAQIGPEHSDLNSAVETALNLIPPDSSGRILVLSDGKWTGKDPADAGARAAGRDIPIDYRVLARPQVSDVAIQSFVTPQSVQPGEAYVLSSWIRSPADQTIRYELRRGAAVIGSGTRQVTAGLNRILFRDRAPSGAAGGVYDYTLVVQGPPDDPIPENNQARALLSVEGARPILLISAASENSGLAKLLKRGGADVRAKTPNECQWSLEELAQYSAVLIENVPANLIGQNGMETLAAWVEDAGGGLMMTGGQKSYGPGGYFKSPLERVMPVSMEMRREHRKLRLAIVVAMDRSGSMSAPVGDGRIKMDLADLGAVQVLDLLSPMDEFGVFAVDTEPHLIVPLDSAERNQGRRGEILQIGSQGGGIVVCEALQAAAGMIASATAQTRHIIMFADAADSRQQLCDYSGLIEKCRESDITISVVGLGNETDPDADILKDVAQRGGGTCYFASNPQEIPRLFAQDTFTVARSTFVDEPTPFDTTAGFSTLGSAAFSSPPALGGYNLCYVRPEANLAAVTGDSYHAPVVASWQAGNGRALCFAGEADGKFSGALASWEQAGEFYTTLARWTAGKHQALPDDQLLTEEVRDGVCFVQLHLDPERKGDPFSAAPRIKVLHGIPGAPASKQTLTLQWKNADLLEAAVPITGRETVLNTVEIQGQNPITLPPVCLPYSPEFAPDQPGRGAASLAQLATTTGGKERLEIPQTWAELQVKRHYIELAPWLFIAAVILLLAEILERRTGWFSRVLLRKRPAAAAREPDDHRLPQGRGRRVPIVAPTTKPSDAPTAPKPATAASPAESTGSTIDALRKARERANRRSGRDS